MLDLETEEKLLEDIDESKAFIEIKDLGTLTQLH